MNYRRWLFRAITVALMVCVFHAATLAAGIPGHLPVTRLQIETDEGMRDFRVSVASHPQDRRRGLMYVTELEADQGMLFDFGGSSIRSMWMKNTPLSLDMLFLRDDGSISSIARDTVPYTRTPIFSEEPVKAVLELKGGVCRLLDIQPGDRVFHPIFGSRADPSSD